MSHNDLSDDAVMDVFLTDDALEGLIRDYYVETYGITPPSETLLQFLRRRFASRDDGQVSEARSAGRRRLDADESDLRAFVESIEPYANRGEGDVHSALAALVRHPEAAADARAAYHVRCLFARALQQDTPEDILQCIIEAGGGGSRVLRSHDRHGETLIHEASSDADLCTEEEFRQMLASDPGAASQRNFEPHKVTLPQGTKPGSVLYIKAGRRYLNVRLPNNLPVSSSCLACVFWIDPGEPLTSENVMPSKIRGMFNVKAPSGTKRGEKFTVSISGRQISVVYPRTKLKRRGGVIWVKIPKLPENIIEAGRVCTRKKTEGQIPLHVASDPMKVRLLLRQYTRGVTTKDSTGSIPLHYHLHYSPRQKERVDLLLDEGQKWEFAGGVRGDCGLLVKNDVGKTPLDILCSSLVQRFRLVLRNHLSRFSEDLQEPWEVLEKCCSIAYEAQCRREYDVEFGYGQKGREMDDGAGGGGFVTLHSIVGMGCPVEIVQHALVLYPRQATVRDFTGQNILSVAASAASCGSDGADERMEVMEALSDCSWFSLRAMAASRGDDDENSAVRGRWHRSPLHWALRPCITAVEETMTRRQNSDRDNESDRIHKGDNDAVVNFIADLCPWQIEIMDPVTNLYPFMLAAADGSISISTVYELLRNSPGVMDSLVCSSVPLPMPGGLSCSGRMKKVLVHFASQRASS